MTVFISAPDMILLWVLYGLGFIVIPVSVYLAVSSFIKAWRDEP